MPIPVICQSCHARFQVNEKFAGKQGPCPKCKAVITIPKLEEQVVIHAPELEPGAKDSKGRSILKPIKRKEAKVTPVMIVGILGGVLLTFAVAWLLGRSFTPSNPPPIALLTGGMIIISVPVVMAGYSFLRDDELEPYTGTPLIIRSVICAAIYCALWGGFAAVKALVFGPDPIELFNYLWLAPPFLLAGTGAAYACLDLEFGNAFFHYAFFLVVTVLLRVTMGLPPV